MKTVHLVVLLLAIGTLCACQFPKKTVAVSNPPGEGLTGKWYRGDGLGMNISLVLSTGGSYEAVWSGCLGEYGSARGSWVVEADKTGVRHVRFSALEEKGTMAGELTDVEISENRGEPILVPLGKDRKFFDKYGPSQDSCFQKWPLRRK